MPSALQRTAVIASYGLLAASIVTCGPTPDDVDDEHCPGPLELGGELGGELTVPGTREGCPAHRLTSDLTISDGGMLIVEPGARIEAQPDLFIRATDNGALAAVGTATRPVVFTAADPVLGWKGLDFLNSMSAENRLEHVAVEFAGSSKQLYANEPASIALTSNKPTAARAVIKNSLITKGLGNGIEVAQDAILPEFVGNSITGHAGRAAYVYATTAHWLDGSSSYSGNDKDEVFVRAAGDEIAEDVSWDNLDAVYVIDGTVQVRAHLVIEAGAALAFRSDARLHILGQDAALYAVGTPENEILFTGYQATAGFWRGIAFSNATSPDNVLEHVVVEYAGQGNQPGACSAANVAVGYTVTSTPSRATIRNSTLRHSAGCGISVCRDSAPLTTLEGNTYEGNAENECIQS